MQNPDYRFLQQGQWDSRDWLISLSSGAGVDAAQTTAGVMLGSSNNAYYHGRCQAEG